MNWSISISMVIIFIGLSWVIPGPMISQSTSGPKIWVGLIPIIVAVLVVATSVRCQRHSGPESPPTEVAGD